jgi:hypothetical protein
MTALERSKVQLLFDAALQVLGTGLPSRHRRKPWPIKAGSKTAIDKNR